MKNNNQQKAMEVKREMLENLLWRYYDVVLTDEVIKAQNVFDEEMNIDKLTDKEVNDLFTDFDTSLCEMDDPEASAMWELWYYYWYEQAMKDKVTNN